MSKNTMAFLIGMGILCYMVYSMHSTIYDCNRILEAEARARRIRMKRRIFDMRKMDADEAKRYREVKKCV